MEKFFIGIRLLAEDEVKRASALAAGRINKVLPVTNHQIESIKQKSRQNVYYRRPMAGLFGSINISKKTFLKLNFTSLSSLYKETKNRVSGRSTLQKKVKNALG